MKRSLLLSLGLLLMGGAIAQTYQPTWESLDKRPVPQWFKDAKFGIFIHWGVYAVPGWCTKGNYSEWYQNGLNNGDSSRIKFHKAKFGDRSYYDLEKDFKAELYNPDEWAQLFEKSGAKYIVLTSKHHDGFCLWPNKESNRDWGFPWNAVDAGPKRDLLGDLFTAVRKTSVHPGMYYSLYEWFNPLWKSDPQKFSDTHTWPQMKELVNTYKPDVFWTDGDWDASDKLWKSQQFISWLYNESPVKDRVVTYDRWGSGVRFTHGNIYTPEYQPDLDFEDHYFEESRGMGFSYGYNREEDAWDYNSAQSLVLQLIDKVSRGGNFLLDIGPDEHGKIPPIMQERLLQIGDWMNVNGEAIYGTSRWKTVSQWSEGRRDYKPASGSGDLLLKLTVDPDPGYAVKEVFYTYNSDKNDLYAILPRYPDNGSITLHDIELPAGTAIKLLASGQTASWKQTGKDVEVTLPAYNPNKIKTPYAFVLKIAGFGKFAPKPSIHLAYKPGSMQPEITLSAAGSEMIHYTTDGSVPTTSSPMYMKPFTVSATTTIKACSFLTGAIPGAVAEKEAKVFAWHKSSNILGQKQGLRFSYFEPSAPISMKNAFEGVPVKAGNALEISLSEKGRKEKFGLLFNGFIKAPADGFYTFFTTSDDGSQLLIDDELVVDNDGDHGATEKSGRVALKKGYHKIAVRYYDSGGGNELSASWQPDGGKKEVIPSVVLFR